VLEYHAGIFNDAGDSQGATDMNDQKAVIGRFALHPGTQRFEVGASGGFEGGATPDRRERAGAETQYRDSFLTLRAEAMTARDGELRRFGYYGLAAARPWTDIQLVGRFDSWDKDRSAETSVFDALEQQYTLGASYLLDGGVGKFAVNYVRSVRPNVAVPSSNIVLIAFQAVW